MVKHVEEWNLSKNVDRKNKVYVRSMKDYIKPCIREHNPDNVIINVGTNELESERQSEMIAKSIIDAAKKKQHPHSQYIRGNPKE